MRRGRASGRAVCWLLLLLVGLALYSRQTGNGVTIPDVIDRPPTNTTTKRILFWTTKFSVADFGFGFGREPFVENLCPVSDCETTRDRAHLLESDAVVFHGRDLDLHDLPSYRLPRQRWVFHLFESPINTFEDLNDWSGFFNWTMTYRADSDIKLRHTFVDDVRNEIKLDRTFVKSRFAVWFVSNCHTSSRREELVSELQRYIPVDVFGYCGPHVCHRTSHNDCLKMAEQKYKFYLSFENSLCRDYVTEKFTDALNYNIVPVTYGLGDYSSLVPPNSYIDALNFSSVRELADFLIAVNNSDALYDGFLQWKRRFVVPNYDVILRSQWCDLCAKLHDQSQPSKVYNELADWWVSTDTCVDSRPWLSTGYRVFRYLWTDLVNYIRYILN